MADPFISPFALTIYKRPSAHIEGNQSNQQDRLTHHTSIILKVQINTIGSSPRFALAYNDSRHDLLTQLGLALLHGGHDHIADAGRGETVEACADALDRDDVQIAGAGVVAAVEDGSAVPIVLARQFWVGFRCCARFAV